ncbi:hypothetical protein CesoFtcFv8_009992 [Champsocephalus esox]|nr:hypothetical protein CesoFtcFv8_009992 [Champsocephalus esox]
MGLRIPALSPSQEGTDASRSHTAKPSTLPPSHPVGDSCSANRPRDATLPCHRGRTARILYLFWWEGKLLMICL